MRVCDLGCSDGALAWWLGQRYGHQVDGIELDPAAAQRARARGINCPTGRAQDAPDLLEPGSYDAVACFELLEHVADPDLLLDAAERMLAPGGRVHVSTPDGTFGAGANPNHLRVYRAVDLADTLRRRGRLVDMQVGTDGVALACYEPGARLGDVAIYCGASWMRWAPWDIATRGLGGSETAAVRVAEGLSALGYVVTVYGEVSEGCYRDILFRHHTAFDPLQPRQAVISSRIPGLFDRPVAARVRMLWAHDTDFGDQLTQRRAERIDHVLTLSRWHEAHVAGRYPFLADGPDGRSRLVRTRNGVHLASFTGGPPCNRDRRVLCTSSPDRGLDVLLDLWPRVRDRVPDATLAYCYAPCYDAAADLSSEVGAFRDRVARLADQPGVVNLGALSQPTLARAMRSSTVWCHPSWCTIADQAFYETSCIGALEAQAAGCVVVASRWGALGDTVRVGRLVDAPAGSDRWRDGLVAELIDGLTNRATQEWAQREGPRAVSGLGWGGVADQVARLCEGELAGPDSRW